MGSQTAIAQRIVTQGGDYLLSVKDNQPRLHEAMREFFAIAEAEDFRHLEPDVSQTLDKGHWWLETRCCTGLAAPAYFEELARWKDVSALVKIEARREMGAKVKTETRYAITSLAPNAGEILRAARLHWASKTIPSLPGCRLPRRRLRHQVAQRRRQFRVAATLRFEPIPAG